MEKEHVQRPSKPNGQDVVSYRPRVVVKFHDYEELPYEDGIEDYIQRVQIGSWERLVEEFQGITIKRLYTALEPEKIQVLVDQATELDPSYHPPNLLTYFAIDCPPGVDPELLSKALSSWWTVQTAYVESGPAPPPQCANPTDDPRFANQGYLKKAPGGIDAKYAWNFPHGCGKGIQFVDIEYGWMLNHEDLKDAKIKLISGVNKDKFDHGTEVLGVVVAVDNKKGGIGIAPYASARVVSIWKATNQFSTADAILSAINALKFGDVLLLELQTSTLRPIETEWAAFDMVRLGTALGIVIVEAAGNDGLNLDFYKDSGKFVLNRTSLDFKDSGAVMVAAASSTSPHTRVSTSNFGSRVDCYAWGEDVDTCSCNSSGNKSKYTTTFAGTSSASAIIAGAALVVQGIVEATLKRRFSAWQLRAILGDENLGTPAVNPPEVMIGTPNIGVMPDLKAIIDKKLNVAPDVYIRDFVGDTGDPHKGAINASPDIILLPSKVKDPQKSFGEKSGKENSNTLGHEAVHNQKNYIYVRVRNRGGSAAKDVVVTVYWSYVATLVHPNMWKTVDSVKIPNVPSGDLLTVSGPITWPANKIPGKGHYCFVGLVGNADDPAPKPADFNDWNKFRRFIRENNNVTWRNFNVVSNVPPPLPSYPPDYVPLHFLAPGAPEIDRRMRLEVVARLPEGARAWLEAPLYLIDIIGEHSPFLKLDEKRQVAWLPLNPYGRTTLGEALFPANSETELKLIVNIPKEFRENEYEVFVSQLYEDEEVGRVTWRLVPEERLRDRERWLMKLTKGKDDVL